MTPINAKPWSAGGLPPLSATGGSPTAQEPPSRKVPLLSSASLPVPQRWQATGTPEPAARSYAARVNPIISPEGTPTASLELHYKQRRSTRSLGVLEACLRSRPLEARRRHRSLLHEKFLSSRRQASRSHSGGKPPALQSASRVKQCSSTEEKVPCPTPTSITGQKLASHHQQIRDQPRR